MAPVVATTTTLLFLVALIAGNPIHRRQDGALEGINTDPEYWCTGTQTLEVERMQSIWEDPIPDDPSGDSVGAWLSRQAELFTLGNPNDDWADNIMLAAAPQIGVSTLAECGTFSDGCKPQIDCVDWATRGFGPHYWAIQAVVGFHNKLNLAHEFLQDVTIANILSLGEIAGDFTAPSTWSTDDDLYAALGAIFYMFGGAGGFGGLAAGSLGSIGARATRRGVAKAAMARQQPEINKMRPSVEREAIQKRLDDSIRTAQDMAVADDVKAYGKSAAALGASTYMVGGVFGVVGIGTQAAFGEVKPENLETKLRAIFENANTYLEQMGRLALGRADPGKGDDYNFLPGQDGMNGPYPYADNAIAQLFHDGNMLIGSADPTFQDTLDAAFATMRPRIVDQALVTGGFFVFADEQMETEERCREFAETGEGDNFPWRGSQWVDGYCMRLARDANPTQLCANGEDFCAFFTATDADYDNLQSKYGFNMVDYFRSALDCKLNNPDRKPDLWALPADGAVPRCWWGIEARKGVENCGTDDGGAQTCSIEYHDF